MINQKEFKRKVENLITAFHPLNGSIEVTKKCNASCGYCYIKQEPSTEDLPLKDMQCIIDKLYDAGVFFLCITGGEPFIRPDIVPLLEYCVKKDFFKISILTNGTLLNDGHIAFIGRNRDYFSFVKMSVFSHIPEVHDAYSGVKDSLRTIINNAQKLRQYGVKVFLSLNALDFNCDTFESSKTYFEEMGFAVFTGISKLINSPGLHNALRPLTQGEFFSRFLHGMPREKMIAYQNGLKNKIGSSFMSAELCTGLYSNIHISNSGEITPCISFRKLTIGNIFDKRPVSRILRESDLYNRLRSMKKTDCIACRQCIYLSFCKHCTGVMHSEFGDFNHAPEQFCNFNKALHEMHHE